MESVSPAHADEGCLTIEIHIAETLGLCILREGID